MRAAVSSWLPFVQAAGKARFHELTLAQRQLRSGYEVYPSCDHKTAVVRHRGKPFPWYADPDDASLRDGFRYRARPPVGSVHATGFGAGCVFGLSFVVMMSDRRELEQAVRAVGEFLVHEDLAGEIDLVVSGVPTPL